RYFMGGLRPPVDVAARARGRARGRRVVVDPARRRRVRADARAERPGRVRPRGRDARHDHGRQRLDADRARSARDPRRRRGGPADWWLVPVTAALAAVVYLTSPAWLAAPTRGGDPVAFAAVKDVIDRRCVSCHSRTPTDDIFRIAPNGVTFDTPESIRARVETIRDRTVVLKNMPLGNKTGMTDAERSLLARWL